MSIFYQRQASDRFTIAVNEGATSMAALCSHSSE